MNQETITSILIPSLVYATIFFISMCVGRTLNTNQTRPRLVPSGILIRPRNSNSDTVVLIPSIEYVTRSYAIAPGDPEPYLIRIGVNADPENPYTLNFATKLERDNHWRDIHKTIDLFYSN